MPESLDYEAMLGMALQKQAQEMEKEAKLAKRNKNKFTPSFTHPLIHSPSMRENIIEKAKKLRNLSEGATPQEAETAFIHFEALVRKYEISEAELENEKVEEWEIKCSNFTLFCQIKHSLGLSFKMYHVFQGKKKVRNKIRFSATLLDYLAIMAKYDFYQSEWKRKIKGEDKLLYQSDKKAYLSAFIHVNDLYPETNTLETTQKRKTKPKKHHATAAMMTMLIDKSQYYKALT